jgi:hypothetical protein
MLAKKKGKKKDKKKGGLSPSCKPRFAGLLHPLAARGSCSRHAKRWSLSKPAHHVERRRP